MAEASVSQHRVCTYHAGLTKMNNEVDLCSTHFRYIRLGFQRSEKNYTVTETKHARRSVSGVGVVCKPNTDETERCVKQPKFDTERAIIVLAEQTIVRRVADRCAKNSGAAPSTIFFANFCYHDEASVAPRREMSGARNSQTSILNVLLLSRCSSALI